MNRSNSVATAITSPVAVAILAFTLLLGGLSVMQARAADVVEEIIVTNPNPEPAPLQPREVVLIRTVQVPPTRVTDGQPPHDLILMTDGTFVELDPATEVQRNANGGDIWDGRGLINPINLSR